MSVSDHCILKFPANRLLALFIDRCFAGHSNIPDGLSLFPTEGIFQNALFFLGIIFQIAAVAVLLFVLVQLSKQCLGIGCTPRLYHTDTVHFSGITHIDDRRDLLAV